MAPRVQAFKACHLKHVDDEWRLKIWDVHRDLNFFLSRNAYVAAPSAKKKLVSLADRLFIFAVSVNKSYINIYSYE